MQPGHKERQRADGVIGNLECRNWNLQISCIQHNKNQSKTLKTARKTREKTARTERTTPGAGKITSFSIRTKRATRTTVKTGLQEQLQYVHEVNESWR